VLAYAAEDEDEAEENVDRLAELVGSTSPITDRSWSETLSDPDIDADGRVTVGTFASSDPGAAITAYYTRDSLFYTE